MTDESSKKELDFIQGNRAAWVSMLETCLSRLGYDSPEAKKASWIGEREAAIATLRIVCAEHGDNEWEDDLHLSDIIDKHLAKHLSDDSASTGTSH